MRFPLKAARSVTSSQCKLVAPAEEAKSMMNHNRNSINSNNNSSTVSNNNVAMIPVGFRFHPTDEELVGHYLHGRVTSPPPDQPRQDDKRIIRELDLYRHEPWDLSEVCRIPGDHSVNQNNWYFFSHKDKKYPTGNRANRATKAGFWKATGRDKCIQTRWSMGMRKTLVFYRGRAPHGQKTDWIMHEFRLDDGLPHPASFPRASPAFDHEAGAWVVCRVFRKVKNLKSKDGDTPSTSMEEDHNMTVLPENSSDGGDDGGDVDYLPPGQQQQLVQEHFGHYHPSMPHCKQELSFSASDYNASLLPAMKQHDSHGIDHAMLPPSMAPSAWSSTTHSSAAAGSLRSAFPTSLFHHPAHDEYLEQQQQQQMHMQMGGAGGSASSSAASIFSPLQNTPFLALMDDSAPPPLLRPASLPSVYARFDGSPAPSSLLDALDDELRYAHANQSLTDMLQTHVSRPALDYVPLLQQQQQQAMAMGMGMGMQGMGNSSPDASHFGMGMQQFPWHVAARPGLINPEFVDFCSNVDADGNSSGSAYLASSGS